MVETLVIARPHSSLADRAVRHDERDQKANVKTALRAKPGVRFSKHHSGPPRESQSLSLKQHDGAGLSESVPDLASNKERRPRFGRIWSSFTLCMKRITIYGWKRCMGQIDR